MDSFAHKSSRGMRSGDFHGLVNDQCAGGLTSDGSNSIKKKQFGPLINEVKVTHSHIFIIGGFIFIKTSGTSLANLRCYPKFDVIC